MDVADAQIPETHIDPSSQGVPSIAPPELPPAPLLPPDEEVPPLLLPELPASELGDCPVPASRFIAHAGTEYPPWDAA
jgi:hypothetical protein